jgi:hypothetical protein
MKKGLIGICLLFFTQLLCAQEQIPEHLRAFPQLVRPHSLAGTPVAQRVGESALAEQYEFLRSMPSAWVEYARSGVTRRIEGELRLFLPEGSADLREGDSAPGLLSLLKPALLARGTESLTVRNNNVIGYNRLMDADERVMKMEQSIRGIPVRSAVVNLSVHGKSGAISSVVANFLPDRGLPQKPAIAGSQAIVATMKELSARGIRASAMSAEPPTLAYVVGASIGEPDRTGRLVWCVEFVDRHEGYEALVDAIDGHVIVIRPAPSGS